MLASFPVPILAVAPDAVRDLSGHDAIYGLWTVFTKCKGSVQDGRRLENISWRLWYREFVQPQLAYHLATPQSPTPHPMDERHRSSYFSDQKLALKLDVLASGLPSPSDQASPSPLPPPVPTMIPPSTPERPRISPHAQGSTVPFTHGRSTPCVGRVIVDMLPNHLVVPRRKFSAAPAMAPSPPTTVSCDLNVPVVHLPPSGEAPFPRVVVVNPTPHPTPPATPVLHDGVPQPPSAFLLPPLPPPALRPPAPLAAQSSSLTPARTADIASSARPSDRRFFLQQSPENASPERGDGSSASGKSPSDGFEASSVGSSQVKSVVTDVDENKDDQDDEEDRRSATTAGGAGSRHAAHGRHTKPKRGKEVGKRPVVVKRTHSAKHIAPAMVRKLSSQHHTSEKKGMFNIGSGSSNGSRSATGSTDKGNAKPPPVVNGFTAIQPAKVSPPPVIPNGCPNGRVPTMNGNADHVKANANGNANPNAQSRKTIVMDNSSSEEFETTDGEDSEEWASEDMDAEDRARQAEESRLREAALEAQRQRDLFAKVPKRSYSNLNRTQSGLLSQLMNPDPAIFPPNHPYRTTRSSADIPRQYQLQQQRAPLPQRSTSAYAPPRLSTSKSAAALPMAAQITAISSSKPQMPSVKRPEKEKNGYRPKGPPQEQEMEDDSGDDADDRIQISQSVAHQKLQALMSRKTSEHKRPTSHVVQPVAMESGLSSARTAPIPLGHPYNLPAAAPPMTPRTTRRRMLKTELSESMRRQLLWERQVSSNANPAMVARRTSTKGPMTSASSQGIRDTPAKEDKDEQRRRAMARNKSWADDYHCVGW